MKPKSQTRKLKPVSHKQPLTPALVAPSDPPSFAEKISDLDSWDRRYMRKWFKDALIHLEEAKRHVIAYREDEECASDTLSELTFLIDDLFASCINLIEYHPGIDDLGDGQRLRPAHQSFDEHKAYGKVCKIYA